MNETVIRTGMVFQMPTNVFDTRRYLGGGAPKAKLPPAAAPSATPPTPAELQEGDTAGDRERALAKKRKGRRSTILTESGLGGAETQRQSLLGNTGA